MQIYIIKINGCGMKTGFSYEKHCQKELRYREARNHIYSIRVTIL